MDKRTGTPRKPRNELSLLDKKEVLELLDKGVSHRKVADQFNVSKAAVTRALKRKAEILSEFYEKNRDDERKRKVKSTPNDIINNKVYDFFVKCREANIAVNGPTLQDKAREIARFYSIEGFSASNGWLTSFLARNNIIFRVLCGESASVNVKAAENWKHKLPDILREYCPGDRFNADETGLFYRQCFNKSYVLKGETCKGGKLSKDRLSVLLCCSSTGEKLKPLVIGKAKYPRVFKSARINVNNLPVTWRNNGKSWMTRILFDEWLVSLNRQMQRQNRKILLVVDNATCHKSSLKLSNILIIFLPPNLTSEVQPLDQGIIRAVKARYRANMLRYLVSEADAAVEGASAYKKIDVLHAVRWLSRAWEEVSETTIIKCFKRAGFPGPDVSEEDSADEILSGVINTLPSNLQNDLLPAEEIINMDEQLICHEELTTSAEGVMESILQSNPTPEDQEDHDEEEVDKPSPPILSHKEASEHIQRLLEYSSVHKPKHLEFFLRLQTEMEEDSYLRATSTKQTKLTSYFSAKF